jgi:Homeodomain-like domain
VSLPPALVHLVGLQIIRDWVRRFNGRGPEGLLDGKSPGQPSKLNDPQRQAIAQMIESGPIPAVHGVVRWRLVDFVIRLAAEPWRLAKIPRKCTAFYDFQPQNHPLDSPKTHHFMAAYGPIAKKVIYVESGGPLNRNYRKIPYARVSRPIWPLDEVTTPGLVAHRIE